MTQRDAPLRDGIGFHGGLQTSRGMVATRKAAKLLRQNPLGAIGLIIVILLIATALFAEQIAPYSFTERVGTQLQEPSRDHFFGTDRLGRDMFSRVIFGSRATVKIGLGAAAFATFSAMVIGVSSGFLGGWYDLIIQRLVDTFMSLPGIVVVLSLVAFAGGGEMTTVFVLGLLFTPGMSRVIRSATLQVAGAPYIESARASGATELRLMVWHTLPNVLAPTIVVGTLAVGNAILAEAALSFLGFGVTPPTPSWGQELNASGRQFMLVAPWLGVFPGLAIALTVFGFNMLGDAIRDISDPRLRV